jgi:ribosomal-protein-alanine N-acetyltransferase
MDVPHPPPDDPVPTIPIDDELTLTPPRWEDRAAHLRHLNASPLINHYLSSIPYPYTEADADAWLEEVMARRYAGCKEADWTIRLASGEPVGECWLLHIHRGNRAEIGYWVAPEFWGRGVAARAVRAVSLHAFRDFDCWKVMATIRDGNEPSRRVLEKAGFAYEATLSRHTVYQGRAYDVHFFGLWRDVV